MQYSECGRVNAEIIIVLMRKKMNTETMQAIRDVEAGKVMRTGIHSDLFRL